jgi:predicted permease
MAHFAADLRYAWRSLRQSPVFTAVAVLSIALGIGANAAIFTLVDQVLLRLLPVKDPARMVLLKGPSGAEHYGSNYGDDTLSYQMYEDIRDHNDVFDGTFCRYPLAVQIGFNGGTERASGELVSGSYFPVLGVGAAAGRVFGPEDDRVAGGHSLAVLSYGYWTSRFLRDPSIIGKALLVNDQLLTVIGVAQEGFAGLDVGQTTQVFVPVMMKAQMTPVYLRPHIDSRRSRWVNVFGRLKSGVTADQAQAHLQPFFHSLLEMEVKEPAFARASAYTKTQFLQGQLNVLSGAQGWSRLRSGLRKPLWVLMGLVAGVLLIACANVANLLVARAAARQREIAIRLALGATRAHIVQQMLVESLLIAFVGGAAGLALAMAATAPLLALLVPAEQQVAVTGSMDLRLIAFAFGATVFTGVLFGLLPALQAARPRLATTLKDQAGSVAGGGALRLRKALVVAQVALSLLLLIGAGLFIRSVQRLMTVDLGFRAQHLVSFSVDPTLNGYGRARGRELHQALLDRLQATPGVDSMAFSAIGLLGSGGWDNWVTVEGYKSAESETIDPHFDAVSPGYFATLGIPLIAGRDFEARDIPANRRPGDPESRVAIVSEAFARKYFAGSAQAIGRHIGLGKDPGTPTPIEIIGVSKDARIIKVREEPPFHVFLPSGDAGGTVLIRTRLDPAQILPTLRSVVHDIDPNLPMFATRTVEGMIQQSTRNERLMASLSAVFGTLATLLATVGLYGVLAYTVTRRTREIGIRMALGALRSHVSWLVLREVVLLAAAGMAIALPTAWWLGRFVESQLYDVAAMDPAAISAAMAGLAAVALLAGLVPTLRATRINPIRALRQD